jgi:hypothetical protein
MITEPKSPCNPEHLKINPSSVWTLEINGTKHSLCTKCANELRERTDFVANIGSCTIRPLAWKGSK